MWHECDTSDASETRTIRTRHECYTNDTIATRVKNFDFSNDTSENTFSHPYIYYIESERLQREEQFHSKNYLLKMPCPMPKCIWKVHHKNWILQWQKFYQNFIHYVVAANVLARSREVTSSNAASFLMKIKTRQNEC